MKKLLKSTAMAIVLLFAGNAVADDLVATAPPTQDEVVVVTGHGVRQNQTMKASQMAMRPPGTSPIKLVERLPGVNYTGADAFGAYEWAVRINVRGFAQQQMGFTLDGVPLGDMSYGNFNGLHISRAVISENMGEVKMSQGAGLLGTNSTSNLGGTLQFASRKPQTEQSATLAITGGSDAFSRIYGRYETGSIEALGDFRGYLAFAKNQMDKWKGVGQQNQSQLNVGFVWPVGDLGEFSGFYNSSNRREADYQDLSKEMIARLGYNWDNFAPDWALANLVADIANNRGDTGAPVTNVGAGTLYPAPIATVDDAYFDASGLRDDELMRLSYDGRFNDKGRFGATIYSHDQKGQGLWFTPYVSPFSFGSGTAGVTSPISVRTTEYDMNRLGGFFNLSYEFGNHEVEGGLWVERNRFNQARRYYANTRARPNSVMNFQRGAYATQWEQKYNIDTAVFHIQDTWRVNENLTVLAGFKSLRVAANGRTPINGFVAPVAGSDGDLKGTIVSKDNFLPQIGFTYNLANNNQIFASYTENMRDLGLAPFSNRSQISFEAIKRLTNPESSKTLEGGFRFRGSNYQGVVAAYFVTFDDRLLGIAQGAGIIGNPSIISNVGGVETKGIEFAGSYNLTPEISLFGSYSYNDSQYKDNVVDALGVILQTTAGKTVVNAPNHLLKADLGYDNGNLFANLSANYTSERETSYSNLGGKVDSFTTLDISAGYRFSGSSFLDGLEAQINVTNLLGEQYISTVGTNGFAASDLSESNQTFMVAPPRQAFVTLRKRF